VENSVYCILSRTQLWMKREGKVGKRESCLSLLFKERLIDVMRVVSLYCAERDREIVS
jgi:hypothetical protein